MGTWGRGDGGRAWGRSLLEFLAGRREGAFLHGSHVEAPTWGAPSPGQPRPGPARDGFLGAGQPA